LLSRQWGGSARQLESIVEVGDEVLEDEDHVGEAEELSEAFELFG